MSWNHRLVLYPSSGAVRVMEVYYDNQGKPFGCSNAAAIYTDDDGITPQESIQRQLEEMILATRKPILNMNTDFIGEPPSR